MCYLCLQKAPLWGSPDSTPSCQDAEDAFSCTPLLLFCFVYVAIRVLSAGMAEKLGRVQVPRCEKSACHKNAITFPRIQRSRGKATQPGRSGEPLCSSVDLRFPPQRLRASLRNTFGLSHTKDFNSRGKWGQ